MIEQKKIKKKSITVVEVDQVVGKLEMEEPYAYGHWQPVVSGIACLIDFEC